MADNVQITAGAGTPIRTDDVGAGIQVQYVKLMNGTDAATDVIPGDANGLDVDVIRLPALPAGTNLVGKVGIDQATANANEVVVKSGTVTAVTAITNALPAGANAIGKLAANSGVDIGDVDVTTLPAPLNVNGGGAEATALRVTLANDSTGVLSVDDNGGALTVDGTVAVTNASLTTIAGAVAGTEMQVDVLTIPTITVNAHAVTNAGTFATQVDGAALTALQLIDNMISGSEAQVDIVAALPAGTNAIGKLAANSGVDIGDVDVTSLPAGVIAGMATLPAGTNAIGKLAANSGVDIGDVDVTSLPALAAGTNLIGKVQPMSALLEGGLTELVGVNEQVDQNDYCGSIGVALGGTYSGEILAVAFYATEDGTGAVQDSAGILYVLDADPSIASGDTAMSAAARVTVIGKLSIGAADWDVDANGGLAYICNQPIPFHSLASLFFVWKHLDATSLNDAAGDDEQLEFNFWYKRES